jgi:hypothetical protein
MSTVVPGLLMDVVLMRKLSLEGEHDGKQYYCADQACQLSKCCIHSVK